MTETHMRKPEQQNAVKAVVFLWDAALSADKLKNLQGVTTQEPSYTKQASTLILRR